MKNVLLISGNIQDINRMRRYFDSSFSIKATSSPESAASVATNGETGLIIYNVGGDFDYLFTFYKEIRKSKLTKTTPLIIIADLSVLKHLTDYVELTHTKLVGSAITRDNMRKLIYGAYGEIPPEIKP